MATPKNSDRQGAGAEAVGETQDFVTMTIAGQLFGIPVLTVQDILGPQKITRIPLAPPEVAGSLNLRGRIVTAMDVRLRLGLRSEEHTSELQSLMRISYAVFSLKKTTPKRTNQ